MEREEQIDALFRALENGDLSEDEDNVDENNIDYYYNVDELLADLEDIDQGDDDNTDADPPLISDDTLSNPSNQNQSFINYSNTTRNLIWKNQNMELVDEAFIFRGVTDYPKDILDLETPFQFFNYFFNQDLLQILVHESNKYATQINPNFSDPITELELRKFIGILIYMSVYHYPNVRSYWASNVRFQPISDTMTVNRFEKIRQILHFNDNNTHLPCDHPQHDRLHKIRTVVDHLNERFRSAPFDHRLSVDEQICATKLRHFMKQYLPNKPHKWGFKLYVLCCLMGYAYSFEIYSGTQNHIKMPNEPDLGAISNTVVRLLRHVPRKVNHIVYFDNFYTCLPLFHYLYNEGIYCLGTVQRNRLGKSCKLPEKKDVLKTSVPRGSYSENVTNFEDVRFSAVSWKDNRQVLLLSTYIGAQPVDSIGRFDKKQKKAVTISCPKIIKEYNAHMGGVDTMDSYLGRYRIRMKSKKWTNRIFYHLLDLSVINSWVLYKKLSIRKGENPKKIMPLVDFRTILAETLCKYGSYSENKRGRPSLNKNDNSVKNKRPKTGAQILPVIDVRKDGIGHDKSYEPKRNQCKYAQCKKLTSVMCSKCKVSLCDNRKNNCFDLFHK